MPTTKNILRTQRILSGMSAQFNHQRPGRRANEKHRLKILAIWEAPPAIRGRPSFFSLGDKHQLKFGFEL